MGLLSALFGMFRVAKVATGKHPEYLLKYQARRTAWSWYRKSTRRSPRRKSRRGW